MILVFGGTTEGRKAIEALEEAGNTFYYSTKTGEQDVVLHHGVRVDGAMDADAMRTFCQEHDIQLVIDAAHPFAEVLHQTIAEVVSDMQIPAIRFERIFPERETDIVWIDDYSQVPTDIHSLLATTGVQSISKLKWLEAKGVKVIYRILNRESSIRLAHQQGASDEQLCFYEDGLLPDADAILLKESGLSGGFVEKVAEARKKGMKLYAIKRPETPKVFHIVNGEHGLRRMVEKLLPEFYPLHSGLTTGTCATAAAIAATRRLLYGETPHEVPVLLPNGETIMVAVGYGDGYAYCIKEAGDDPDVTDGIEIRATTELGMRNEELGIDTMPTAEHSINFVELKVPHSIPHSSFLIPHSIIIEGGDGVGRFTLPGFDFPPGEPAINKGPRQMIRENIKFQVSGSKFQDSTVKLTISVPNGAEIAKKTFNPRLGIEGGISIIGVSGIVKPFSEEAFIESIRKCVTVAIASGTDRIVIHSGMKSANYLQQHYPNLPQQAFVEYGNAIGETLKIIAESSGFKFQDSGFRSQSSISNLQSSIFKVTLGIMLGKAVKLAEGHLDTHSKKQTMNKAFIMEMLREAGCGEAIIAQVNDITLARELWGIVPPERLEDFCHTVIQHCMTHCQPLVPHNELTILLMDDNGHIYGA